MLRICRKNSWRIRNRMRIQGNTVRIRMNLPMSMETRREYKGNIHAKNIRKKFMKDPKQDPDPGQLCPDPDETYPWAWRRAPEAYPNPYKVIPDPGQHTVRTDEPTHEPGDPKQDPYPYKIIPDPGQHCPDPDTGYRIRMNLPMSLETSSSSITYVKNIRKEIM
jgi:hypothetical protein